MACYQECIRIHKTYNGDEKTDNLARWHREIAIIALKEKDYVTAIRYFEVGIKMIDFKEPDQTIWHNELTKAYRLAGKKDEALECQRKLYLIVKSFYGENSIEIAAVLAEIASIHHSTSRYADALSFYNDAIDRIKNKSNKNHLTIAKIYFDFANLYYDLAEYKKALEYLQLAYQIKKNILSDNHIEITDIFNRIGNIYEQRYEMNLASDYYNKSLEIALKIEGENSLRVAQSYINIGKIFCYNSQPSNALELFQKTLKIRTRLLGEKNPEVAESYASIGYAYEILGDLNQALNFYTKGYLMYNECKPRKYKEFTNLGNKIGLLYLKKHDFEFALEQLFLTLEIQETILGKKHADIARTYNLIGDVYKAKNMNDSAIYYYHRSICSNLRNFNDTLNVWAVPEIKVYLSHEELFTSIYSKIISVNLTYRNKTESIKIIKSLLGQLQVCDTLINIMQKEYSTQNDKIALFEKAYKLYHTASSLCFVLNEWKAYPANQPLYYKELAFYFCEKSKSSVLLEALAGKEAQKFAGIPEILLKKARELNNTIAYLRKQIAQNEKTDSTRIVLYQNKLFIANRSLDSLILLFETQYPQYYQLKYNRNPVSIKTLRDMFLKDNKTAILSYSLGDLVLMRFLITRDSFYIDVKKPENNFADTIEYFHKCLNKADKKSQSEYKRLAYKLYDFLFFDFNGKFENIIIIPDNILSIIPFETLIDKPVFDTTKYKNLPFIIKKYIISYSYSATLLSRTFPKQNQKIVEVTNMNDWLAFAPVFNDNETKGTTKASRELIRQLKNMRKDSTQTRGIMLSTGDYISPLPGSEAEVDSIFKEFDKQKYKAKVQLRNNVTEKFVKSGELSKYKILHFATHGFVNSEQPELSGILLAQDSTGGNDGILYSGEIYNLQLNSDLVVLSACETGLGQIKKGEGIIGLTRALLYAGTKNIIVSLWQVSDASTSQLMIDFYKNILKSVRFLKSGRFEDGFGQSLRQAKLKMISEGKYAHPFFWSPFILIGK